MIDTPTPHRPRPRRTTITVIACVVALLAAISGYALLSRGFPQPVPEEQLAATLDTYATVTADALGTPTPRRGGNAQPCDDYSGGNRYQLIGFYDLTYPDPTPDPAVERVRIEWQQRGYDVGEPRYLDDGSFLDLDADDLDNDIGLSLRASGPGEMFLRIDSPCVRAPSGQDPN
ncbi:MAG: hypothetical protein H7Y15_18800 [Pseudonocardia sp.]|nr:hypothetical protein [Pseudonocardia sp.]